ncbi:hypothetical protein AB0L40_13840 [Patulibacter sp. NPDC049589]|uniref:hypothetical protein n=1 Tax=Patulibacter sp. NPDC049589 TaxID=3154731 RepID=UPI00341B36A5
MCIQCAAGAMTAVAGASGMRMWLETRFPALTGPRTKKIVRRSLMGGGVLAASLLGSSSHVAATPSAAAARPAAVARVPAAPSPGSVARLAVSVPVRQDAAAR